MQKLPYPQGVCGEAGCIWHLLTLLADTRGVCLWNTENTKWKR